MQRLLTSIGDDGPLTDHDSLLLSGRLQSLDTVQIIFWRDILELILRRSASTGADC